MRSNRGVGENEDSMVAMSGAIMPAPLAMPLTVTTILPIFAVASPPSEMCRWS